MPALPADVMQKVVTIRNSLDQRNPWQAAYWLQRIPKSCAGDPDVMAVTGLVMASQGVLLPGMDLITRAAAARPDEPQFAIDSIRMLCTLGRAADAQKSARALIDRCAGQPAEVEATRMLVQILTDAEDFVEAAIWSRRLAEISPDRSEALVRLTSISLDERRFGDALQLSEKLMELSSKTQSASTRFFALLYSGADGKVLRAETEAWCKRHFADVTPVPHRAAVVPVGRKLRVGYLSGDFRAHVVARFFGGVLREHDRSAFWVACYSNVPQDDSVSASLKSSADLWRNVSALPDDDAARVIAADKLDILVDLGGHTATARLGILARKPAPVIATYLGYPATTGLAAVDYRITDGIADPVGMTDDHNTEKLWRLGRCAWAFELSSGEVPDLDAPNPSAAGATFTFGSFNLVNKVNQKTLALWARAIAAVDSRARLVMAHQRGLLRVPEAVAALRDEIAAQGADPDCLVLADWKAHAVEHRDRLKGIDLMLDTLSYNGTTTTCESLWFGVPILTLPGNTHASRVGLSLLSAAGLEWFAAADAEEFVRKAVELHRDPARLNRREIRRRVDASPLRDFRGLARALEKSYHDMVREKASAESR